VNVHVSLDDHRDIEDAMSEDGLAAIALLGAPFGMVMGREEVTVEVTLDTGEATFVGRASASKLGSVYAHARRRALAAALDQALARASVVQSSAP
jgi:hypothetical protein